MRETQMSLRPLELLLVEDSASDILLITQTLREQPFPINVQVAVDGEKALQVFADGHFRPDLVILDLNIPKVHGFDVLRRCSSPEMRIVVFSSSSNRDDLRRSFELGAQEFVHKPIALDEFRQQVTQIVRNWGPPHLVNAAGNQLGD
jgi:DNA-binding response OmpR family regulator